MALDVSKIIQYNLPSNCYNMVEIPKTQIYLHHTAGGANAKAVVDSWKNSANKIATAFVIAGKPTRPTDNFRDGDIVQAFPSKYWAYHLGLKNEHFSKHGLKYQDLNGRSIGIEICNWGYVTKGKDGKFRTYVNSVVPAEEVVKLNAPYRGYEYYHAYTPAQLQSVRDLLVYLCDKFHIPKVYNEGMFDISVDALSGKPGIWTHTSVRPDKFDCSKQKSLIEMLKSL